MEEFLPSEQAHRYRLRTVDRLFEDAADASPWTLPNGQVEALP